MVCMAAVLPTQSSCSSSTNSRAFQELQSRPCVNTNEQPFVFLCFRAQAVAGQLLQRQRLSGLVRTSCATAEEALLASCAGRLTAS